MQCNCLKYNYLIFRTPLNIEDMAAYHNISYGRNMSAIFVKLSRKGI